MLSRATPGPITSDRPFQGAVGDASVGQTPADEGGSDVFGDGDEVVVVRDTEDGFDLAEEGQGLGVGAQAVDFGTPAGSNDLRTAYRVTSRAAASC